MMHYYQHNIGDYARDTGHLTILEHGIYRMILDWCYLNEKPITTEQAIRIGRGNPVETQSVLSEFFSQENDGWTHKRVSKEVAEYHIKSEKNRQNGIKGGRPKPTNNPVGSQTDAKHNPNQEPLTINHKPIKEEKPRASATPSLKPQDVDEQVWTDWVKLRKEKKAAITKTALDGIEREAEKAGIGMEDALKACCEFGWQGFNAGWYEQRKPNGQKASTWAGAI
jgi:uncharacterized protein YdaU (DUF1376 family)